MSLQFAYFYGAEAEQYSFYRIPKVLFSDRRFKGVSMEARVLYGLMLDRMGLSVRNGWLDDDGRVYIYFTLDDAIERLACGKDKALKLFKELDTSSGIALIQRCRQGQGKPARVYVMNFTLPPETEPEPSQEPPSQTSEKPKSALRQTRSQDFGKADCNKTDKNNTYQSDTESPIPPLPPLPLVATHHLGKTMRMDEMRAYRVLIHENIDYDILLHDYPHAREIFDGYVEQMVKVCVSTRKTIRVNQENMPVELVRSRLLKLNRDHIVYVMDALQRNTSMVGNVKAYTLSALYNAPVTISQYYTSLACYDMARSSRGITA